MWRSAGSRRCLPALLCVALTLSTLVVGPAGAAGKKPDLVVTAITASPTSAFPGDPIEIETKTLNKGKATAGGSTTSIYLSVDATRGPGDKALKRVHAVPKLKPGRSARATLQGVVPRTVTAGGYRVIACADSKKKVAESKEGNNCRTASAPVEIAAATSEHLIEEALESGDIDEETALEYRVFAAFGDPRLPAEYEGDDSEVIESDALVDAATRFTSLSPDAQATLAPFLIPPYHAGSHWSGVGASAARPTGAEPPAETPWCDGSLITENWNSLDTLNGKVRVWWQQRYNETDRAEAEEIVDAIDDKIWPGLTSLMGREPLSDASVFGCDGGDGKLDIALVDAATATTVPATLFGCKNTAAHILFDRGRANRLPYVAHEIMHAIQFSYSISEGCGEYEWLREATAQWVQDYISDPSYGIGVAPDDTEWEHEAPKKFLGHPEMPLESLSPQHHDYGAYVFFFYLARVTNPSVIPEIWNNTTSMDSLEAIKPAIGGAWDPVWKEFAKYNWNQGSLDHYKDWDGLTSHAALADSGALPKGETNFQIGVKHLATKYITFVPQEKLTSLDFTNKSVDVEGAGVQAIIKYKDGTDKVEDWSDEEKVNVCLEDPEVESITLVLTNSNSDKDNKITHDFTWEGFDDLCCTSQPAPRAARAVGASDCEGDGTITWTWSHVAEGPGGWEHVSFDYNASAQMTFDFVATDYDPDTYEDTGNSSYTYSGSGVEERNRGYSEGCGGDVVERWESQDSRSGTFRSAESEPSGFVQHDGTFFLSAVPWYDSTMNYTLKCGSDESSGTSHTELAGAAFVICPQEAWNFGVTLQPTAETATTRSYSIDCSSTDTYERNNMTHTETVNVTGSITLSK